MSPHLNEDQLIAVLYGLNDAEGHAAGCAECLERLKTMRRIREETSSLPASPRLMAEQRQRILESVQARPGNSWRWIPAAAGAAIVAMALFLSRPEAVTPPAPAPAAVSAETDSSLFMDVYSMEQQIEPTAAAPIRGLFQEASYDPAAKERRLQ